MVYISTGSGNAEVWRSNPCGKNHVQLINVGSLDQPPSNPKWSPDRKQIAYIIAKKLYGMDSDGNNQIKLSENVSYYSWSNDSTKIAYSTEEEKSLLNSTFITDLNGVVNKIATNFNCILNHSNK